MKEKMSCMVEGALGIVGMACGAAVHLLRSIFALTKVPVPSSLLNEAIDIPLLFDQWRSQMEAERSALAQHCSIAPLVQAQAWHRMMDKVSLLELATRCVAPSKLSQAEASLKESCEALAQGHPVDAERLAKKAQRCFGQAVYDTYGALMRARRKVFTQAIAQALDEMHYKVSISSNSQRSAIWAMRDDKSIAVVLQQDGSVRIDTYGFSGISCSQEYAALRNRLSEKGLRLQSQSWMLHGDLHGGVLVNQAAQLVSQQQISMVDALLRLRIPSLEAAEDLHRQHLIIWEEQLVGREQL